MVFLKRDWIRIENEFHLWIDLNGELYYKKFKIYDDDESVIAVNKKLKEGDIAEQVLRKTGEKVTFI